MVCLPVAHPNRRPCSLPPLHRPLLPYRRRQFIHPRHLRPLCSNPNRLPSRSQAPSEEVPLSSCRRLLRPNRKSRRRAPLRVTRGFLAIGRGETINTSGWLAIGKCPRVLEPFGSHRAGSLKATRGASTRAIGIKFQTFVGSRTARRSPRRFFSHLPNSAFCPHRL